ncbi:MAG: DUF4041 domain-containing protein [Planctomycetaceae bacterium]|nr:DUF4041 domain-containing protein [Planctomycetaceae bacterium]
MTNPEELIFNPPPGWPRPPATWRPPPGWRPDPSWPAPPPGWQLWVRRDGAVVAGSGTATAPPPQSAQEDAPTASAQAARIAFLEAEVAALRANRGASSNGVALANLSDEQVLQEVGIYRYHHPLEDAAAYRARLDDLTERIARAVTVGEAVECSSTFTYDNSLAKGRKMTKDFGRLMLRAYNAEVENSLRTMRVGNVETAKRRVESSRETIARLGAMMEMHISDAYHAMRMEELELTADFLMKKQEEREAARDERARLREERRVAAELEAERERLDKERAHIVNAIHALQASGNGDPDLEQRLVAIDSAIRENDFRAANVRAGYVYVISNRGAFGEGVVKIGLTRRLTPSDRIDELSGASVPFTFDVHCLFFSVDAVSLETELHHHFTNRRLNCVNTRKE